jgi:hypothetical protein
LVVVVVVVMVLVVVVVVVMVLVVMVLVPVNRPMHPNHQAYHNELVREGWAFHDRFYGRWGAPAIRPITPFPPYAGKTDDQLQAEREARAQADRDWWHTPLKPLP